MFHRLFYASQPETAASYYQRAKMSSRETKQVSRAPARQPITIHTHTEQRRKWCENCSNSSHFPLKMIVNMKSSGAPLKHDPNHIFTFNFGFCVSKILSYPNSPMAQFHILILVCVKKT